MDNISYHGTNLASACDLIGPPSKLDVNTGKGEFGKGFYTGSSISVAAHWARQRYGTEAVVVKFDIPEQKFVQLKGHLIKTRKDVSDNWAVLKADKKTNTYISGHDYIFGPFATIEESGIQYKFESQRAENELRDSTKQLYSCAS